MGLDTLHHRPDGNRERHIVGIEGVGDYYLVTGVETGQEREQHGLRTSRGDDYLVGGEPYAAAPVIFRHLLPQRAETVRGAVLQYGPVYGLQSLQGAFGSLDVGLAYIEVIDLYALAHGLLGKGSKLAYGRGGHVRCPDGNLFHIVSRNSSYRCGRCAREERHPLSRTARAR